MQSAPSTKTHETTEKPAEAKTTSSKPPVHRPAPTVASKKPQANVTASKSSPAPSSSKISPKNETSSSTVESSTLPPKAPVEEAAQPSTPAAQSKAAVRNQQPSTPVQNAVSTTDGQSDLEWNAAALPLTPQSQKRNPIESAAEAVLTNGTATSESSAAAKTRRSLMETPDLAGKTIH